jgi:S-adenosylmethionine:diacylglycerol 3-amino-3-carboxypropyl transferase
VSNGAAQEAVEAMRRKYGVRSYEVFEGYSARHIEGDTEVEPTLERAMRDLWERSGLSGEARLRVIDIEVYGSNPIDMFHVIASDH